MKNIVDKDYIRRKLSKAHGSDVGEVYPELFLRPQCGPFDAIIEVIHVEIYFEGEPADFYEVSFTNRQHYKLIGVSSAS